MTVEVYCLFWPSLIIGFAYHKEEKILEIFLGFFAISVQKGVE